MLYAVLPCTNNANVAMLRQRDKDLTTGGTWGPFKWKQTIKDKSHWSLTLCAPPWWSLLQPRGDICAFGVCGPDAPDGPCRLHRM